jgi:hypothetical protein
VVLPTSSAQQACLATCRATLGIRSSRVRAAHALCTPVWCVYGLAIWSRVLCEHSLPECIWACAARYRHVGALSGEVSAVCYSRGTLGTPGTRRALGAACKWDGDVR